MKQYKYTGCFKSATGDTYMLDVMCNGFIQALFLLTADAIRSGKHYQLKSILDEDGIIVYVSSILNVHVLLSYE